MGMQIRLLHNPMGSAGAIVILPAHQIYNLGKGDQSILVADELSQSALVAILGAGLCTCGGSDGTVACPCASVDQHVAHARQWLASHDGSCFPDPGYYGRADAQEAPARRVCGQCPDCLASYEEDVPSGILPGQEFWVNCGSCNACITIQYPSGNSQTN